MLKHISASYSSVQQFWQRQLEFEKRIQSERVCFRTLFPNCSSERMAKCLLNFFGLPYKTEQNEKMLHINRLICFRPTAHLFPYICANFCMVRIGFLIFITFSALLLLVFWAVAYFIIVIFFCVFCLFISFVPELN